MPILSRLDRTIALLAIVAVGLLARVTAPTASGPPGGSEWSQQAGSPVHDASLRAKVTLSGGIIRESSPAAADFDGDGDQEIVVGGQDGMLYVIAYDGASWGVAWARQTALELNAAGAPAGCGNEQTEIRASPAVADLDNDGHLEIVVSTGGDLYSGRNGGVLVYRYSSGRDLDLSFSPAPGWPQPRTDEVGGSAGGGLPNGCWDPIWSTTALGDLDGDGDLEVVVEGLDRRIHAWHHDGARVGGWPIYRYDDAGNEVGDCLLRGGWSSPALGDLDGDGLPEVVVGTGSPPWNCPGNWKQIDYRYATVWAINGDSSNVPGWPVTTYNDVASSPALGDIDGDGQLEVVSGSGRTVEGGDGRWVYAWEGDGRPVTGWPKQTAGDMHAPPALGDIDSDGDLEVVIGCGRPGGTCTRLYAWHGNGNLVSGFPLQPPTNDPWVPTYSPIPESPVLADLDGNGSIEILVTHYGSRGIATVRRDGSGWVPDSDPSLRTDFFLFGSPLVDDLDNDGLLEMAIGGGNEGGGSGLGALYIWELTGSADSERPWPMFHHNAGRTGQSPRPPELSFPAEIRLYHTHGSGDTESTTRAIQNKGDGSFTWDIQHAIARLEAIPSGGVVVDTSPVELEIRTTGLVTGWHSLGAMTVSALVDGQHVRGSPATSQVYLYVGDPTRVYLPVCYESE
ncbi:MAG: VCBS repeat-containing protein [Anaerolineae bacterium]|nr:VCBS repeat-containing protein [Anaerolineae bacterium]